MTDKQKNEIIALRKEGLGYMRISKKLNMSINTVKSYCQRHHLAKPEQIAKAVPIEVTTEHFCPQCGVKVKQNEKRKLKKFCSDKCRMTWWNSHRDMINYSESAQIVCANCHKTFYAYKGRKYCSHSCYIQDRFGGTSDE